MPQPLRVSYTRGVTPGKWARVWGERYPRVPLELTMGEIVTDALAQLAALRDGSAALAFIRLETDEHGEPSWPGGARPGDVHFIGLYDERPFVVAPKGNVLEAADEVTVADLGGEVRHPFDDDVATTVEVVAAGVGVVVLPQSLARLYARKDVIARPVADVPGWRVGVAWLTSNDDARVQDFIGVVRGRTVNSSRGTAEAGAERRAVQQRGGDGRSGGRGGSPSRGTPARRPGKRSRRG